MPPRLEPAAALGAPTRLELAAVLGAPRVAWSPLHSRDLRQWPAAPRDLSMWLARRHSHRRAEAGHTHALAGKRRAERAHRQIPPHQQPATPGTREQASSHRVARE